MHTTLYATADEAAASTITSQAGMPAQSETPAIRSKFFSAEAAEALPKLKDLHAKNPGFNKILFKLEGYPKQQEIIFEIKRPLTNAPEQYRRIASFTIQDDGSYLNNDDKQIMPYIVGSSRGFLPGERIVFRFRTADGSIDKEVSGIPAPAIFKDKQGKIAVRAEILSVSPTVYTVDLFTMKEGEEYELKSTSLGETFKAKPTFYSDKPFHYAPAPKGKIQGGHSTLQIKRKSGEVYTMKLPWGTALESYQGGRKHYHYHN